jgi:hypothetical protein
LEKKMFMQIQPYSKAVAVTPSDATVLPKTAGLYVGGAGAVAVRIDSATVLFSGIPAGTILPLEVDQVQSTNTTATLITALYF